MREQARPARPLTHYAWLSIAAAVLTIGLKSGAYLLTGSVGLLSDALESVVNLAAAVVALIALRIAARPPDDTHPFGHTKAEYFSSIFEGALILVAAGGIVYTALPRLVQPQPLERVGLGLAISLLASLVNLGVALTLYRAGKQRSSITLEANAKHLMADVWTSLGVLLGIVLVALTGWLRLDPIIALVVAANILFTGWQLIRRSTQGLMDAAMPPGEVAAIEAILARYQSERGIGYHDLRTRQAGAWRFVDVHILTAGAWTVQEGHDLLEQIEEEIKSAVDNVSVTTHLEPLEDPLSHADRSIGPGAAA